MLADLVNDTTVKYDDYKDSLMLATGCTWEADSLVVRCPSVGE